MARSTRSKSTSPADYIEGLTQSVRCAIACTRRDRIRLYAPGIVTTAADSCRLVLVEDDANLRKVLERELTRMGHRVKAISDANDIRRELLGCDPDLVILDLHLPGVPGMNALATIVEHDPDLPVLVCTGHGTVTLAVEAMQRGAFDFLTKPVSLDVLEQAVLRAHTHTALLRENERLRLAASHGASGDATVPRAARPARSSTSRSAASRAQARAY